MTPPLPFTPEQLLEHGRSLRALARRLLLDEGAAEDVVQDAWVLALERPPAQRDRIGGWLHKVVQSLALKRMRGESRRVWRERVAAQPERTASTLHSMMSAASCKRLIDAVLALDEPYRTAISMRYLDDLPPREIASQLDVSVNTVRARLQRGLAQLRQRLDTDSEGGRASWAPAMLVFAGLKSGRLTAPLATATSGGALGVVAMAGMGKWAAGVLAMLVLGFGIMELAGGGDEALTLAGATPEPELDEPLELAGLEASAHEGQREELASPTVIDAAGLEAAAPPAWLSARRYPYELRGRIVDQWGRPLRGERIHVAFDGQRFNTFWKTGNDGRFVFQFDAARASLDLRLYVRKHGTSTSGMRSVHMTSGATQFVHLDLKRVEHESPSGRGAGNYVAPLDRAPGLIASEGVAVRFYTWSGVDVDLPEDVLLDSEEGEVSDHNESQQREPDRTGFSGVVQDAKGEPARRTLVGVKLDGAGFGHWAQTNDAGEFEIIELTPGSYTLHAGGDDYGQAEEQRTLAADELQVWNPYLDRGRELRGRIVPDGDVKRSFLVRAEALDPQVEWSDTTVSDAEGRFSMPNAPRGAARVLIFDFEVNPFGVPLHVEEGLSPDGIEREILLASNALETGSISLSLLDAAGAPVREAEIRLHHAASRRGVFMQPDESEERLGHYSATGLPAGSYRLEANSPALGWIVLESVVLHAAQEYELGQLAYEAPGLLIVNSDPEHQAKADAWQIVHLGETVDSYAWNGWPLWPWQWVEQEAPGWVKVQLPAGDYALSVRGEAAGQAWFPFSLESGGESTLDLPLALLSEVSLRFVGQASVAGLAKFELVVSDEQSGAPVLQTQLDATSRRYDLMLLPGTYTVQLLGASSVIAEQQFEVGAATTESVKLQLR